MRFPLPLTPPPYFPGLRILILFGLLTAAGMAPLRACVWIKGTTLEGLITQKEPPRFSGLPAPLGDLPAISEAAPSTASGYAELIKTMRHRQPADFYRDFVKTYAAGETAAAPPAGEAAHATFPDADPDWPDGLDEAVKPIFHGHAEEARQTLEALNTSRPGNYYILANLAVAGELCGRDQQALENLETALRLKPDAHSGTEWIHAAVLRAKIALSADPAWLETHTISGIPPDRLPAGFVLQHGARTLTLEEIHHALLAHSIARTLFVKPPDPVTAALLKELARVQARWWMVEGGLPILDLAEEYGARDLVRLRTAWQRAITHPHRPPPRWLLWLQRPRVIVGFLAGAAATAFLIRSMRRRALRQSEFAIHRGT